MCRLRTSFRRSRDFRLGYPYRTINAPSQHCSSPFPHGHRCDRFQNGTTAAVEGSTLLHAKPPRMNQETNSAQFYASHLVGALRGTTQCSPLGTASNAALLQVFCPLRLQAESTELRSGCVRRVSPCVGSFGPYPLCPRTLSLSFTGCLLLCIGFWMPLTRQLAEVAAKSRGFRDLVGSRHTK